MTWPLRLLALAGVLAGCSGHSPPPARPEPVTDAGPERPLPQAGSGSAVVAVSDAPTEADCDALLAHTIELAVAARPADQRIGTDEQAKVRGEVRAQFQTECQAMQRATFTCAQAAKTQAELADCK